MRLRGFCASSLLVLYLRSRTHISCHIFFIYIFIIFRPPYPPTHYGGVIFNSYFLPLFFAILYTFSSLVISLTLLYLAVSLLSGCPACVTLRKLLVHCFKSQLVPPKVSESSVLYRKHVCDRSQKNFPFLITNLSGINIEIDAKSQYYL